jgi:pSer/pThr/pTyr-binding forkhead associated (FHA) protein
MQVKLKVLSGSSAGRELKIPGDEFLIGRSDACNLRPKSDSISRKHCILRVREGRLFVEDLGSRNGSYLDDERLQEETEAKHGSKLRLGRLEFQVVLEQQPASKHTEPSRVASSPSGGVMPADGDSSSEEEDEITKWLEEGDFVAQEARKSEPETRQFRLDETERVAFETTVAQSVDSDTKTGVPEGKPSEKEGGKGSGKKEGEDRKKQQPGKLPPRAAASSTDSRQAASEMLKRFFNRP